MKLAEHLENYKYSSGRLYGKNKLHESVLMQYVVLR